METPCVMLLFIPGDCSKLEGQMRLATNGWFKSCRNYTQKPTPAIMFLY
jgi:hypothetical protein